MSRTPKEAEKRTPARRASTGSPSSADFDEVVRLIEAARTRAMASVNATMIGLYWSICEYIKRKIATDGWGQGTVEALAEHVHRKHPNRRGFSARNLWRMMQFVETYSGQSKLAPLVRELSWTHNLLILSRCKRDEEREFYLRLAAREKWGKRELERQLKGALFDRVVLSPLKVSPLVTELHPEAATIFKDSYRVEFLELTSGHSEADLERALIEKLKQFLIELGRDFCFIGSQYPLQVGGRDFAIDLLFFNRALNCLVAFELKIEEFQPEHLGKLEFYLESLDRDVRKPHERPSIAVLLCATKDHKVVEYALSRAMSPALVAEYQTRLPDKKMLQAKLHEFYRLAESQAEADAPRPMLPLPEPSSTETAKKPKGRKK